IIAFSSLAERQHKFLWSYLRMLEDETGENTHQKDCLKTCLPYYLIPFVDPKKKQAMWKRVKGRTPEDVLVPILPQGMNREEALRSLSNGPPQLDANGLVKKMTNSPHLLMTPCAALLSRIIITTMNGIYYRDGENYVQLSRDTCILPHESILLGDMFQV
ncbi:hypothetical protein PENTCL1PPCAC_8666, partial [Pristionchus entomophagus]